MNRANRPATSLTRIARMKAIHTAMESVTAAAVGHAPTLIKDDISPLKRRSPPTIAEKSYARMRAALLLKAFRKSWLLTFGFSWATFDQRQSRKRRSADFTPSQAQHIVSYGLQSIKKCAIAAVAKAGMRRRRPACLQSGEKADIWMSMLAVTGACCALQDNNNLMQISVPRARKKRRILFVWRLISRPESEYSL